MKMSLPEQELVIKAKSGDYRAFEELVYAYDRRVFATIYRFTGDLDDAKDLYQDIFIRAFRGLKNFEFKSSFSTWLYRIAINVCLTYKAKTGHRRTDSLDAYQDDEDESGTRTQFKAEGAVSPEGSYLNSEIKDRVKDAVNCLSPRLKMVFILKHFEGYKIREIADMLETKEGTIKKYLFEAVHSLRNDLKSYLRN